MKLIKKNGINSKAKSSDLLRTDNTIGSYNKNLGRQSNEKTQQNKLVISACDGIDGVIFCICR
jgi:hypothetical protein